LDRAESPGETQANPGHAGQRHRAEKYDYARETPSVLLLHFLDSLTEEPVNSAPRTDCASRREIPEKPHMAQGLGMFLGNAASIRLAFRQMDRFAALRSETLKSSLRRKLAPRAQLAAQPPIWYIERSRVERPSSK
jgi:hypothetical protein